MRPASPNERRIGMEYYVSDTDGTGGRIRESPADFRVSEVETIEPEPPGADPDAYPNLIVRARLTDWETAGFASALSDRLGISRERIRWAGTKDKRAVTTQLLSIRGVDPDDLPPLPGADLEAVGRFGRGLRFGDHGGNRFEIVVRGADFPEHAGPITEELRAFGAVEPGDGRAPVVVPNYFGPQRFGSRRPVTHEVGLRVLDRDWEAAVLAYVANPFEAEPDATREARTYIGETRDWAGGLERVPDHLGYERAMLHRLAEADDGSADFRAALEAVPTSLQRLFVHAAQSFVFNRAVSARLADGLPLTRAVAGDVVCFAGDVDGVVVPDADRLQRVGADEVDAVNRHCARGRAFVTAPLVGTGTDLGDGPADALVRAVLDDLDLEPAAFDLPAPFGSTGTRRPVAVATPVVAAVEDASIEFSFTLPPGSYATVVLREYLKTDEVT